MKQVSKQKHHNTQGEAKEYINRSGQLLRQRKKDCEVVAVPKEEGGQGSCYVREGRIVDCRGRWRPEWEGIGGVAALEEEGLWTAEEDGSWRRVAGRFIFI